MPCTLILIPTVFEADIVAPMLVLKQTSVNVLVEVCGFGPIVSGIRTAQLIARHRPDSCLLLGIAGSFGELPAVGTAGGFDRISCYGVGVGDGSEHQSAESLGWDSWPDETCVECRQPTLHLRRLPYEGAAQGHQSQEPVEDVDQSSHLLTACSASASFQDAQNRHRQFPDAVAEDMEGYAVGLACLSANIPLTVIRGISNRAGDRNKTNWLVPAALSAAAALARSRLRLGD